MIARKRYNNDTAYFQEKGKENDKPVGARLNDVVGGRFRLTSISAEEVILEDVSLGFKHKLALFRTTDGQDSGSKGNQRGGNNPQNQQYNQQYNPNVPNFTIPQGDIPGIPNNAQRAKPQQQEKKDDDDGDN